nr:hypothetical protein [Listeria cornellensis]
MTITQIKKISSLTDASGRSIKFAYTNGMVSKITAPENRTLNFTYDTNKQLTDLTTARGKKYSYAYTDGLLTSIYNPKHTVEKPYKTVYEYTGKQLTKVTDPLGKVNSLAFNPSSREASLTNAKGMKTIYKYNLAGNPEQTIVDANNLKLTTRYVYEANNLVEEVSPKGQVDSYTYDGEGNIISSVDPYGKESYVYNGSNNVISSFDTSNNETTIAYDGQDAISETNQSGAATSSVSKYDQYGNEVQGSSALTTGDNLLKNAGFEKAFTATDWFTQNSVSVGNIIQDKKEVAPGGIGGGASIKVTTTSGAKGFTAAKQLIELEPDTTYTVSGYIKTSDIRDASAFLNMELRDATGKQITDGTVWVNNRYSEIKADRSWTKRQFSFQTSKNTAKGYLFLEVEQPLATGGSGTAWFDNLQVEKRGDVMSTFNPISNSSFEGNTGETVATDWQTNNNPGATKLAIDTEGFTDDFSAHIARTTVNDADSRYGQEIFLNQKTGKNVTLTGMSKSENVVNTDGKKLSNDYALFAQVMYNDGTSKSFYAPYPTGTNDWNRSAVTVEASKPITSLYVWTLFRGNNTGKTWFDNIRIIDGEVLYENVYDEKGNYIIQSKDEYNRKVSYSYDIYGNKLSEKDANDNTKKMSYNEDNQLAKVVLANGASVAYVYDDNGSIAEKRITADGKEQLNSYAYDVDNKMTKFTDAIGNTVTYDYDNNANETKTSLPNGNVIETAYDSADRKVGVKWNNSQSFNFQYDANGNEIKVIDTINALTRDKVYDDADRIVKQTERGSSVSWAYKDKPTKDNKGKTDKVGEITASQGNYSYKATYEYNNLDQNTKISDGTKNYFYYYDEQDNISTYMSGNGVGANYVYDYTNKVSDVTIGNKSGANILEESYTYDALGNRVSIDNKKDGKTLYKYDEINQLTKESLPDGTELLYTYDDFGNRIKAESSKGATVQAKYSDKNQLIDWNGKNFTYDKNGNRTSDDKYSYSWNANDQLVAVTKKRRKYTIYSVQIRR